MTLREYSLSAQSKLRDAPIQEWATLFIKLREECWRLYANRLIFSTSHGVDFFDNILAGSSNWKEEGEYGKNFRTMLNQMA